MADRTHGYAYAAEHKAGKAGRIHWQRIARIYEGELGGGPRDATALVWRNYINVLQNKGALCIQGKEDKASDTKQLLEGEDLRKEENDEKEAPRQR